MFFSLGFIVDAAFKIFIIIYVCMYLYNSTKENKPNLILYLRDTCTKMDLSPQVIFTFNFDH